MGASAGQSASGCVWTDPNVGRDGHVKKAMATADARSVPLPDPRRHDSCVSCYPLKLTGRSARWKEP